MKNPEFIFIGCVEIKELLGIKAENELQLMEYIEDIPADSIYYHTHSYFLRHHYIAGPYTNDFANWAVLQLRDRVLGEKLAAINPWENKNIENIRMQLLEIIDNHTSSLNSIPAVTYGQPFYFMKSKIIPVQTGLKAKNIKEFVSVLKIVDASAIYYHMFEAKLRGEKSQNDFSNWIANGLDNKELAEKIEKIDVYMYSLENLREKLIKTITA